MKKPAVFTEMCDTCIFRRGNPMHLQPGRLQDIVNSNLATGTLLICHKTTYGQAEQEVACRGFYDGYGDQVYVKQVIDRLGGFEEVEYAESGGDSVPEVRAAGTQG